MRRPPREIRRAEKITTKGFPTNDLRPTRRFSVQVRLSSELGLLSPTTKISSAPRTSEVAPPAAGARRGEGWLCIVYVPVDPQTIQNYPQSFRADRQWLVGKGRWSGGVDVQR